MIFRRMHRIFVNAKKVKTRHDQETEIRKRFPLQKPRRGKTQDNNTVLIP